MIFSKDDLDCLNSLYYNFVTFDIQLGRDMRDASAEQWQINAPNKDKLWLTGVGTSVTESYNSLMKRMSETGQFDPPEWNAAA